MLAEATTAAAATQGKSEIIACLKQASAATGSDFDYLLCTAMRESSLKPAAQAGTSSAAGLFQFVQQTWLGMVKQFGGKYGLGSYADAISQGSDGRYHVASADDRQAILALRNDPKVASLMAGEYANQTRGVLQGNLGRSVSNGELYAAHFLGPSAACRLIRMNDSNPDAQAADAFPDAAGANRNVFYHRDGSPKSVREVYDWASRQGPNGGTAATGNEPRTAKRAHVYVGGRGSLLAQSNMAYDVLAGGGFGSLSKLAATLPTGTSSLTSGLVDVLSSFHATTDKDDDQRSG